MLSGSYEDAEGTTHTTTITGAEVEIEKDKTEEADRTATWTVPVYENGYEITYAVTEKGATTANGKTTLTMNGEVYTVTIAGNKTDGFTVT